MDRLYSESTPGNEPREIPGKGVFTVKPPHTLKSRGVACGNFVDPSDIDVYSGGVEAASLRVTLRIAKLMGWTLIGTDVGTAFLNAPLDLPYKIVVYPPSIRSDWNL